MSISGRANITYAVGPAISFAVIGLFNPFAAAVSEAVSALTLWLIKPTDEKNWKKNRRQLFFNSGMSTISVVFAGLIYQFILAQLNTPILNAAIAWVIAALVYQQTNLWLLIGILRLQHGTAVHPLQIWRENTWTMPLATILLSVGGGLLTYAGMSFGSIGILIFFLPIALSAISFRLYVREMRTHMNNLESIIAARTQDLADANQTLHSLNQEKDAFLAVLTHDMKTPLTSIGIYGSLIQSHPHIVQQKPHVATAILNSQKALLEIVNNILDLEKLESGKAPELNKVHFDLTQLVMELVDTVQAQAVKKEITLATKHAALPLYIFADRQHIQRILTNLLSNAIKYTSQGGNVVVATSAQDNQITINVEDDGYGIPQEDLPYIFERYHRVTKLKRKAAGTGLGLAVTKALIESHNGRIAVTSQEHQGSCFSITLPIMGDEPLSPLQI